MKRLCALILMLCLVCSFASCEQKPGSPPTDSVLGESRSELAVMVNGELYYGTGIESASDTNGGPADGEITTAVDGAEMPAENDQSNFGSSYGYRHGKDGTIEVCVDDQWLIFEQKKTAYTFDDSAREVKFSIEYPENWALTEQRGYDGDENRDGSPTTGIQFTFFGSDEELFSIMAMRFSPFGVDESLFQSEPFETSGGLAGVKYERELDGLILAYYVFGEEGALPQYFAAVNMGAANYEMKKDSIDAVMKTFQILTDQ